LKFTQLSSRAIIGRFYETLALAQKSPLLAAIAGAPFPSDQAEEEYAWLGMAPAMREWISGRHAKSFRQSDFTIKNKKYEGTLRIELDDIRRDKTGQIMVRIGEQVDRANAHWARLLSSLIVAGESAYCYDGQLSFDTDHAEGASGSQSNDLSVDISALPVPATAHGSTTAPAPEELPGAGTWDTLWMELEPARRGVRRCRRPERFLDDRAAAGKMGRRRCYVTELSFPLRSRLAKLAKRRYT
jgi:hypothetical protein